MTPTVQAMERRLPAASVPTYSYFSFNVHCSNAPVSRVLISGCISPQWKPNSSASSAHTILCQKKSRMHGDHASGSLIKSITVRPAVRRPGMPCDAGQTVKLVVYLMTVFTAALPWRMM